MSCGSWNESEDYVKEAEKRNNETHMLMWVYAMILKGYSKFKLENHARIN